MTPNEKTFLKTKELNGMRGDQGAVIFMPSAVIIDAALSSIQKGCPSDQNKKLIAVINAAINQIDSALIEWEDRIHEFREEISKQELTSFAALTKGQQKKLNAAFAKLDQNLVSDTTPSEVLEFVIWIMANGGLQNQQWAISTPKIQVVQLSENTIWSTTQKRFGKIISNVCFIGNPRHWTKNGILKALGYGVIGGLSIFGAVSLAGIGLNYYYMSQMPISQQEIQQILAARQAIAADLKSRGLPEAEQQKILQEFDQRVQQQLEAKEAEAKQSGGIAKPVGQQMAQQTAQPGKAPEPPRYLEVRMGNEKADQAHTMFVFADPYCPFCERLESELEKIPGDWQVRIFPTPIHQESNDIIKAVACAKDKVIAWKRGINEKTVTNDGKCEEAAHALEDSKMLFEGMGLQYTPTLVSPDGRTAVGAYRAEDIMKWLKDRNMQSPGKNLD